MTKALGITGTYNGTNLSGNGLKFSASSIIDGLNNLNTSRNKVGV